jgi:AcrR family transcriptional regulator
MDAVSAAASRRAQRKAQNRRHIRTTAQRLFAEHGFEAVTTAEIAAAAGVSVQTVFNHFTRKEELFFDGRAGWVSGPADAVRARRPDVPPLIALRDFLIPAAADAVRWQAGSEGHP